MSFVEREKEIEARRQFVKSVVVGAAGIVVAGSLAACSTGETPSGAGKNEPMSDAGKVETKSRAMTKEQYLEYVDHFNNKRYDAVTSYFTPDITVEYYDNATGPQTPARTLNGPQGFIDNYKQLHETVKEVLELGDFLSTETRLFVELYTEFHTFKDTPATPGRPGRKKGDISVMTNWVMYDMQDGKMKRIRIAHWRNHDPKLAKYKG